MRQCFVAYRNASGGKIKLVDIAPEARALEFVDEMHDAVRISVPIRARITIGRPRPSAAAPSM